MECDNVRILGRIKLETGETILASNVLDSSNVAILLVDLVLVEC